VNDGLSQNHVTSFAQDLHGFVWIGTAVGLNRYDGHEFKVYTHSHEDKASLSGDAIYALHVDGQGRLWVGTHLGLDRYEPATDSFRHFRGLTGVADELGLYPRTIDSDRQGNIWVAWSGGRSASEGIVVRLDASTGESERFLIEHPPGVEAVFIRAVDPHRIVIISRDSVGTSLSHGFSVTLLDPRTRASRSFSPAGHPGAPAVGSGERHVSFASAGAGSLWIGARGDRVFRLNLNSDELLPYSYDDSLAGAAGSGLVSHVVAGINGDVWVIPTWDRPGSRSGSNTIYRVADGQRPSQKNTLRPAGGCEFSRSFVISSQIDRAGVLWAGLSGSGVCVSDLQSGMFSRIHESSPDLRLSNDFVRSVWKTPEGVLWVGTRVGVNRLDRPRSNVTSFQHQPEVTGSLSNDEVTAILVGRDKTLWVGTQAGGLNRDVGQRGAFEHFRHEAGNPRTIGSDHVSALLEDRAGVLWIAAKGGGLNRFNPADRSFSSFSHRAGDSSAITSNSVTSLFEDSKGTLWVGTEDAGLNTFDRASGRFTAINLGLSEPLNVVSLAEDLAMPGVIWVATLRHGLIRYDSSTHAHKRYTVRNSLLPSDTVYSVLSDDQGALWAGTNRGLVRISVKTEAFRIFGMDQGLQSMEFNSRACFRAADGELFFGGVGGLNAFYPRDITQNNFPARVVITQVRTMNREARSSAGPYRILFRAGDSAPAAALDAGDRDLIFNFVALHFADPSRNSYRFKLEGFEDAWRDAGASREATYTNLPPGPYKFLVKAVTSRGVWSAEDAAYSFTIARPFYQTPWFVYSTLAATLAAAFFASRWRVRKLRLVAQTLQAEVSQRTRELSDALELIRKQADLLRETDSLKSRFITNVSHDFRTPLSVTLGTLTDLRAGLYGQLSMPATQELETVIRNERRLLRLVNQLLAVARLDSGKLRLRVVECDLVALAREIVSAFRGVARQRKITLELIDSAIPLPVFCDPEWMEQVITNLVLNALKFTPPGGRVVISASWDSARERTCLTVEDTGPGIPPVDLPRIFDRFYQTERGATTPHAGIGVGLSLAKEIVELHGGEIHVSSKVDAGSAFKILLRAGYSHFDPAHLAEAVIRQDDPGDLELLAGDLLWEEAESGGPSDESGDRPTLVVAEDDRELMAFLRKHLGATYRVLEAESGTEALQLTRSEIPDLVLSDIMMPGLDGYQLCQELRSNSETDFIPVMLLTARAEMDQKLEGLNCGADDYLTKPFEVAELKLRIRNCIDGRTRLKTRLAASAALDSAKAFAPLPDSADAQFLRRVYTVMRDRAHDDSFSVEQLADGLSVSRMQLYRRLQAILGKPPAEVLMDYRLEHAAQMLAARFGTVSEVAYAAGFKSVSHFSRRFREKFGASPTEYRAGCEPQPSTS
jgi:signal transduction histidine kinase/ligand-binding sensor domain-containing protein/DNA-binding response OmpR family regulator